ncbi:MAG: hypothetical protein IOC82_09145 [Aestuariivirga sp.]|uniref:hypothetical protein n=1 Tax=Aestuariivirga sp. TaxID=2650926 RepID=UPI0025C3339E|nr:hypothetical protein [Aestuariivirga sp.]MCA3561175.1 hypothetical protein [Aestuariivirga sp.]
MTEVDQALQAETQTCRRGGAARVPVGKLLQMAEHEAPTPQVQAKVASQTIGAGDTAIGIDRHNDVALRRKLGGEVVIAAMVWRGHVTLGAGARKSVVDAVVDADSQLWIDSAAGAVVAVQKTRSG